MSSFEEIQADIKATIKGRNCSPQVTEANELVANEYKPTDKITQVYTNGTKQIGTIVSKPGTEKIMLKTSTFQLMECTSAAKDKKRSCVVDLNSVPQYSNQFVNSEGHLTYVVTKGVFMIMLASLSSASKQLVEFKNRADQAEERAGYLKLTLDTLKANGVID